jgi:LmbE family N-acetylglucosaminyl deacetylase
MTTLVISPHLDDAVLSIGGSIAAWTAAGERVVVATLYTQGPPLSEIPKRMHPFANYERRLAEDAAACDAVGAQVRWLGCVERAFRKPFLRYLGWFATPADRRGFAALSAAAAAVESLTPLAPTRVLAPLAIGNHVDHVETLIAATDWALAHGLTDRLWFYEDFYALSGAMRRRHFVTRGRGWRTWESPLVQARRLGVGLRAMAVARRGPEVETFLAPVFQTARWSAEPSDVRATEDKKLAAIACYRSQTRAFGGVAGIARATRRYHAWWNGAEPLWRAGL